MTERRHPLSNDDITKLAETITERMTCKHGCPLTEDDLSQVKDLIKVKKGSVKLGLWIGGVLLLLILKDMYDFLLSILKHLTIVKP